MRLITSSSLPSLQKVRSPSRRQWIFESDNGRRGLSEAYLTKSRAFFSQFRDAFGNRLMNDVTSHQAKECIYAKRYLACREQELPHPTPQSAIFRNH